MPRHPVIDVTSDLPPRAGRPSSSEIAQLFGGACKPFGQSCKSVSECCTDRVPQGSYVLCYFYRGHGDFVTGYCTYSAAVYGS